MCTNGQRHGEVLSARVELEDTETSIIHGRQESDEDFPRIERLPTGLVLTTLVNFFIKFWTLKL